MEHALYTDAFGALLTYLFINRVALNTYKEANGIKPLCPTQADVDAYSEFIRALFLFFEY